MMRSKPPERCRHYFHKATISSILLLILTLLTILPCIYGRKLDDIYWNSSNPMFDISNTKHVKTVNLLDRVTIVCPNIIHSNLRYEFTKLFMVSREAYERCDLRENGKAPRQLGVCATPYRQSSISIVFRPFSALSSGLQFRPGNSYYIITTSDGTESGLNKSFGGLCLTRNMKMKIEVLPDESEFEDEQQNFGDSDNSNFADNRLLVVEPTEKQNGHEMLYKIHTSDSMEVPIVVAPLVHSISSIFQGVLHKADDGEAQKLESAAIVDTNSAATSFGAWSLAWLACLSMQLLKRVLLPVIL